MDSQDIKNSILQLAIQGKLVQQNPDEGNATSIVEKLLVEKENLISQKIIKRDKQVDEITNDDFPFSIPQNWCLIRLGDIVYNKSGLSYKKSNLNEKFENMIRVLRGGNISELSYQHKEDDIYISDEFVKDELFLKKNMLITPAVTSLEHIGKMARIEKDYSDCVVGGFVLMLIPLISHDILSEYLLYALSSQYHRNLCRSITNKSGQAFYNLSREKLMDIKVPIPPLQEQKRIVAKIKKLIPIIEKYDSIHLELESLNTKFPYDMKKSILKYAMQGKLVEQRVEDGTADKLYNEIQELKATLMKTGVIKKGKLHENVSEDAPYDIPDNWKWVKMSDIFDVRDGTHDTPQYVSEGYPLITGKDFYNEYFEFSKTKYISEEDYKEISKRSGVDAGDILFSMIGGNIGSMILITEENYFDMAIKNVALFKQYDYSLHMSKFLYYYLMSQVPLIKAGAKGGAQTFVPLKTLRTYLVPLPPLNEQERIVNRIEEMLPYCERLK